MRQRAPQDKAPGQRQKERQQQPLDLIEKRRNEVHQIGLQIAQAAKLIVDQDDERRVLAVDFRPTVADDQFVVGEAREAGLGRAERALDDRVYAAGRQNGRTGFALGGILGQDVPAVRRDIVADAIARVAEQRFRQHVVGLRVPYRHRHRRLPQLIQIEH